MHVISNHEEGAGAGRGEGIIVEERGAGNSGQLSTKYSIIGTFH
jgi:hypothetical protein